MEKTELPICFFGKAISRAFCCYFLVDTALQITLIMYQLPETTGRIDEKVTEETTDQNFSNMKLLTTDAPHTPMTPSCIVWRLGRFLMYMMTTSVGTKGNGPKPARTWKPPTICDIGCFRCFEFNWTSDASSGLGYVFGGDKNSFVRKWVEVFILAVRAQYTFLILYFCIFLYFIFFIIL